jgi:hypothetical protein
MFIAAYLRRFSIAIFDLDVNELGIKLNFFVHGLLSLDAHHFFNSFDNVESFIFFPKLIGFNLGEIKKILDNEIHELS